MRYNILWLQKENERYVFFHDGSDASYRAMYRHLGVQANDPELGFTWYDAAVLSELITKCRKRTLP